MTSPTYSVIGRLVDRVLDPSTREAMRALLPVLMNKEPLPMADIQQALADLDSAVKGVADRSAADVADLQAQIKALQDAGVDTSEIQAIADSIEANVQKLNAIDPVADVPVDPTPTDPPADPTPTDPPADPAPVDPPADPTPADPAPVDPPAEPGPPAQNN